MSYETLQCTYDERTATVTLNRPAVLNALNTQTFNDLEAVFIELVADDGVRVILLTGSGERAFAAGADIRELEALDTAAGESKARRGQAVFHLVETCGKPVLALINGFALGGGCELALACTLRIASESATLGQPEVKLGLIPGYGGTQRLPRLIGQSAALKLMLTGEVISAAEALRIGLVDEVVAPDQLRRRGENLARMMTGAAPLAIAACMRSVQSGNLVSFEEGQHLENELFGRLCGTEDKAEGTAAFLGKRSPVWKGR